VHPVLAPLGAAVVLRPSGGAGRATGIAGPRRPAAAYAARSHEFAAAAAQLLGGTLVIAPLAADAPAPVLRDLNVCDKRAPAATRAHVQAQAHAQPQLQPQPQPQPKALASRACALQQRAERPCFFSLALALHSSML
jgi:hypothetical protein